MLLRVSGPPALRLAMGPALVLALLVNLVLGQNSLSLRDLGALIAESPRARVTLLGLWAIAMLPAARAALYAPGLVYLRWLPVPRWLGPLAMVAVLLLLHALPLVLLLGAGQPALALAGMSAGLAGTALGLGAPSARWQAWLAPLLGAALVFLLYRNALDLAALLGVLLSSWKIPQAWRQAPARSHRRHRRAVFGGSASLSLASVMIVHLWRRESTLLLRCALLLLLGGACVRLLLLANAGLDLDVPILIATTPFVATIALSLALGIERSLAEMRWLCLSMSATDLRTRTVALLLLVLICTMCGLVLAAPIMASPAIHGPLTAMLLLHVSAWASLAALVATLDTRGSRVRLWVLFIVVVDVVALGLLGYEALVFEVALALLCIARRVAQRDRAERHA